MTLLQTLIDGLVERWAGVGSPTAIPGVAPGREFAIFGADVRGNNRLIDFYTWEEEIAIAAAAFTNSAGLLFTPGVVLAVAYRVTVAIPTATTFTIGDPTTTGRFATGVSVAVNTSGVGFLHWNPANTDAAGPRQTAFNNIRITPNSTPGNANGRVYVQVAQLFFEAPTQ